MDRNEKIQSLSRFSNASLARLATQPMDGDTLYVVYKSYSHQLPPYLHIAHVVYGHLPIPFLNTFSLYESNQNVISTLRSSRAGTCNVDYACDAISLHWSKQASSIAILLTHDNQRYYMVLLSYQEKSCRSSSKFKRRLKTLRGLILLNSSNISDYAILELKERIPEEYNVYLAGWTTETKPDWPLIGIHHPQGDVKKLSIYNNSLKPSCWDECPKKSHWKVERWTRGTTESGSSGSPLFDAHHRIVGQLHGGQAACWNKNGYDMYGSFKESWYLGLSNILDPYDRTSKQYHVKLDGVYLNTIRDSNYPEDKL
ncbi:Protease 1 [Choanephora cucurbitarum]|uniref:Protease 1 n=1 Tax=Choanephora cucurbitarum TaxID=101091 RepID=A0A1C7NNW6_9FUNG|nr:Protease 1 [Choanephora cucurbitarum]